MLLSIWFLQQSLLLLNLPYDFLDAALVACICNVATEMKWMSVAPPCLSPKITLIPPPFRYLQHLRTTEPRCQWTPSLFCVLQLRRPIGARGARAAVGFCHPLHQGFGPLQCLVRTKCWEHTTNLIALLKSFLSGDLDTSVVFICFKSCENNWLLICLPP